VAYACNPSYSRGRDQEDRGSKPTQANSKVEIWNGQIGQVGPD
jgi:hypothetical protein